MSTALEREELARPLADSEALFNELSAHYALRCFTLNYDTLIDRQLHWNDGFPLNRPFSRKIFNDKEAVSEPLLCNLHGSILYGRDQRGFITKYGSVSEAIASYEYERRWKPNQAGELNPAGPIISGLRKLDKLTSTPYGYYYSSFVNSIIKTPRLLIIGYGEGDAHLNYWLSQHRTLHATERRVVIIARDDKAIAHAANGRRPTLMPKAMHVFRPKGRLLKYAQRSGILTFHCPELLAIRSGYPLAKAGRDILMEHLE